MDYNQASMEAHRAAGGAIEVKAKLPVSNREELSVAYTPGVAAVSLAIAKDPALARELTATKRMVAVVTDGSAVLGLGNVGPEAALPVMEGKAVIFKEFAGIDAFPIALATQDPEEIISAVKSFAVTFGGINLEDIAAPSCFIVEERLKAELSIPVFHDDQHGTAIVVLAGLTNALKVTRKEKAIARVVISGAGAAGVAIAKLLFAAGFADIVMCDSQGIIGLKRQGLNASKQELLAFTNKEGKSGSLKDALRGADVFIGVSAAGIVKADDVKTMAEKPIVLAMANPTPEIMPDEAKAGGAAVVATGRSDYPNQLNNALVFPGLFKGLLEAQATKVTEEMKLKTAAALAGLVKEPTAEEIIPSIFDPAVVTAVAEAVK